MNWPRWKRLNHTLPNGCKGDVTTTPSPEDIEREKAEARAAVISTMVPGGKRSGR